MELDYIKQGDCTQLLQELPSDSVDLVLTDPPYLIHSGHGGGIYDLDKHPDKSYISELTEISDGFSEEILDELCRVMKKINIYLFCSKAQIPLLLDYFVTRKKCNFEILKWLKTNPVPACGNKYLTDTEYIMFFREKGVKLYGNAQTKATYFISPLHTSEKKLWKHPTIRPQNILQKLVINSSQEGDIVLDPFVGSGSTAIAAMKNKRHFIGFEINADYYKMAQRRLQVEKSSPTLFD